MEKRERVKRSTALILILLIALFTWWSESAGENAPESSLHVAEIFATPEPTPIAANSPTRKPPVRTSAVPSPTRVSIVSTPIARPTPRPQPTPDLATIEKANSTERPLPTFRAARITVGDLDRTSTIKGANGFVVSIPRIGRVSPAVYGENVVIGAGTSVHAFDRHDGSPVWSVDLEDDVPSSVACDEGVCAVNTGSCSLYVIDATTGKPLWGRFLSSTLPSAPTIARGRVFASYPVLPLSGRGYSRASVAALNLRTGEVLWERLLDDDVVAAPVVLGNELRISTRAGRIFRFSEEGQPLGVEWALPGPGPIQRLLPSKTLMSRTPVVAGGSVWFAMGRTVVGFDPGSGAEVASFTIGSTVFSEPAIHEGWIYAATTDGLVAVNTGDPTITGWSQLGGNAQRSRWEKPGISESLRAGP